MHVQGVLLSMETARLSKPQNRIGRLKNTPLRLSAALREDFGIPGVRATPNVARRRSAALAVVYTGILRSVMGKVQHSGNRSAFCPRPVGHQSLGADADLHLLPTHTPRALPFARLGVRRALRSLSLQ